MPYLQTKKSFHQQRQFSITVTFENELRNALDFIDCDLQKLNLCEYSVLWRFDF